MTPLGIRAWFIIGLVLAGIAGMGLYTWRVYSAGETAGAAEAAATIQEEQADAVDAVAKARARVRACYERGGMWDRTEGECRARVP